MQGCHQKFTLAAAMNNHAVERLGAQVFAINHKQRQQTARNVKPARGDIRMRWLMS